MTWDEENGVGLRIFGRSGGIVGIVAVFPVRVGHTIKKEQQQ